MTEKYSTLEKSKALLNVYGAPTLCASFYLATSGYLSGLIAGFSTSYIQNTPPSEACNIVSANTHMLAGFLSFMTLLGVGKYLLDSQSGKRVSNVFKKHMFPLQPLKKSMDISDCMLVSGGKNKFFFSMPLYLAMGISLFSFAYAVDKGVCDGQMAYQSTNQHPALQ